MRKVDRRTKHNTEANVLNLRVHVCGSSGLTSGNDGVVDVFSDAGTPFEVPQPISKNTTGTSQVLSLMPNVTAFYLRNSGLNIIKGRPTSLTGPLRRQSLTLNSLSLSTETLLTDRKPTFLLTTWTYRVLPSEVSFGSWSTLRLVQAIRKGWALIPGREATQGLGKFLSTRLTY